MGYYLHSPLRIFRPSITPLGQSAQPNWPYPGPIRAFSLRRIPLHQRPRPCVAELGSKLTSLNVEHKKSLADFNDRVLETYRNTLENDNMIALGRCLDRVADTYRYADLDALQQLPGLLGIVLLL